jgi:hypothetical protein
MMTDVARTMFGVDGTGVTVGALSDSFDCLGGAAADVASHDLPSGVNVLEDSCPGTDEARAMLQLIHDVAPGADLGTHTAAGGQANFALGIQELAGCPPGSEPGCMPAAGFAADVIADDVLYFAEPFVQDGIIAQAVDSVASANVFYFSAAGNSARSSYESPFISSGTIITGTFGDAHDFDPGLGVDTYQKVGIPAGETVFSFQWDSPFFSVSGPPGSPNDLDICVFDDPPNNLLGCAAAFNVGGDPVEIFSLSAPGPTTVNFVISNFDGPDPAFMKWVGFDSGVDVMDFDTASSTLVGHPNAQGANAVGAAFYGDTPAFGTDPPLLEFFSSAGGTPTLLTVSGGITNTVRHKPEIVAPDGTNTTFFGVDIEPDGFPNFFGTSAAAPHAAGLGALVRQMSPDLSPAGVRDVLESSAVDMGPTGFDFDSGWGLVNGKLAVDAVNPASTDCGPDYLTLDGGPPGSGFFNARVELTISTWITRTATFRAPLIGLANETVANNSVFGPCP